MIHNQHSLHCNVVLSSEDRAKVDKELEPTAKKRLALVEQFMAAAVAPLPLGDSFSIPLTSVSRSGTFEAYINIVFKGAESSTVQLLVDSGNSILIVPDWDSIKDLPGYTVLGTAKEPWGCPVNVVRGPILIPTSNGTLYTIEDCVFLACTAANDSGERTANFGAGCITPWSANGWAVVGDIVLQSPLSYNKDYPFAEFTYAAAKEMFTFSSSLLLSTNSELIMYKSQPQDYTMMNIIKNLEWMSVIPKKLVIGGKLTSWPGEPAIALVDTGGGPVFLSDPKGYVYKSTWFHSGLCPSWICGSTECRCISDPITLELGDEANSFSYTIDISNFPSSVQGLTGVMCKECEYMFDQRGVNIGGITALFSDILVDYAGVRVGFKAKA